MAADGELRTRLRRACLRRALPLLAALISVGLATALFSETRFTVSAFEFTAALAPFHRGETVLLFPPLGRLRAATHWAPLQLQITLSAIHLEMLQSSLREIPDLAAFLGAQLRGPLLHFLLRLGVVTFLCGAVLRLLLGPRSGPSPRRAIRAALAGGLLAVLLLAVLLGATVLAPYRIAAFAEPHFEGALAAAPGMIELSGQLLDTASTLSDQLRLIAVNLKELTGRVDQLQPAPESGEIRVLHVSDIHNNPVALDLIAKIVAGFQIDLIIDTGDLIDYGSSLEAELSTRLMNLPCPYLFLPGNHDTPESIALLRGEGAVILGGAPIEMRGLRIAGVADPACANATARIEAESTLLAEAHRAAEELLSGAARPDILALHNPLMAEPFMGKLPLILAGHTHRAALDFDRESGSIVINAGTTGAAGVRGLLAPRENPYSMVLLRFNPTPGGSPRLTCADLITIEQFPDSFSLQRFYNSLPAGEISEDLDPEEDSGAGEANDPPGQF